MNVKQSQIGEWVRKTFGDESCDDPRERSLRFIEEAIEMVQSVGAVTPSEIFQLVDKKFAAPPGDTKQEAGGVYITFLALCHQQQIGAKTCLHKEWQRINDPNTQEILQRKQAAKKAEGL